MKADRIEMVAEAVCEAYIRGDIAQVRLLDLVRSLVSAIRDLKDAWGTLEDSWVEDFTKSARAEIARNAADLSALGRAVCEKITESPANLGIDWEDFSYPDDLEWIGDEIGDDQMDSHVSEFVDEILRVDWDKDDVVNLYMDTIKGECGTLGEIREGWRRDHDEMMEQSDDEARDQAEREAGWDGGA